MGCLPAGSEPGGAWGDCRCGGSGYSAGGLWRHYEGKPLVPFFGGIFDYPVAIFCRKLNRLLEVFR